MALARTGNVDVNNLYSFLANDTNAVNNVIAIGGQVSVIVYSIILGWCETIRNWSNKALIIV